MYRKRERDGGCDYCVHMRTGDLMSFCADFIGNQGAVSSVWGNARRKNVSSTCSSPPLKKDEGAVGNRLQLKVLFLFEYQLKLLKLIHFALSIKQTKETSPRIWKKNWTHASSPFVLLSLKKKKCNFPFKYSKDKDFVSCAAERCCHLMKERAMRYDAQVNWLVNVCIVKQLKYPFDDSALSLSQAVRMPPEALQ